MTQNERCNCNRDGDPVDTVIAHQIASEASLVVDLSQRDVAPYSLHAGWAEHILQVARVSDARQLCQFAYAGMARLNSLTQLHRGDKPDEGRNNNGERDGD